MTKEDAKKVKPGDLLVQTCPLFEGESKFVIAVKVEGNQLHHVHVNIGNSVYSIIDIRYFRRPKKSELTEEVIRQYKTTLLKLILKGGV